MSLSEKSRFPKKFFSEKELAHLDRKNDIALLHIFYRWRFSNYTSGTDSRTGS